MTLARRLQAGNALLAVGYAASLAGAWWAMDHRERALAEGRRLTAYGRTLQQAAVACRRYLEAVVSGGPGGAADEARRLVERTRIYADQIGSEDDAAELERLSRFIGASDRLLGQVRRLKAQGRGSEAAALYLQGLKPLSERFAGELLAQRLDSETARRIQSLEEVSAWNRRAAQALAVTALLTLVLSWLWARRTAEYLVRNFDRLKRGMAAVASGNFRVVGEVEYDDEVGALMKALHDMARRLEDARRRLETAERQAVLGEVAKGAAHVINNPLAAICGYADLLLHRGDLSPVARDDVRTIREQARRVDAIVRNLRQFVEAGAAGGRERVAVNELLERVVSVACAGSDVSARVVLETQPVPPVSADRAALQHAFYNLVRNAVQAVQDRPGARVFVRTRAQVGSVRVEVEDEGPGIPGEHADRIFEPLFTTRAPGMGLGLGLSSALQVLKAHGGTLEADSMPGRGSRFTALVPAGETGPPTEAPRSARGRVLVVDDEQEMRNLAMRVLGRDGLEVTVCEDAQSALQEIERAPFDLVLSDFRMPGLDGKDLFEAALRLRPELDGRFLFTTGEIVSGDFDAFVQKRGIGVLLKPFDLDELRRVVRERLGAPLEPAASGGPR